MGTVPLPIAISVAQFKAPEGEPTYTEIFHATMGDLGSPTDGLDAHLAELQGVGDALAAEMAAEATLDNVGTAITLFGAIDPGGLDTSVAGFESTKPIGAAHLATLDAMGIPLLLELPMSANFDGGIGVAPTQLDVLLGTVKLGSPPIFSKIGKQTTDPSGVMTGIVDAEIFLTSGGTWQMTYDEVDRVSGYVIVTLGLEFTPDKVGDWLAQVNVLYVAVARRDIITYKVSVVP